MVEEDDDGDDGVDGDREETTVRQLEFLWARTPVSALLPLCH